MATRTADAAADDSAAEKFGRRRRYTCALLPFWVISGEFCLLEISRA